MVLTKPEIQNCALKYVCKIMREDTVFCTRQRRDRCLKIHVKRQQILHLALFRESKTIWS